MLVSLLLLTLGQCSGSSCSRPVAPYRPATIAQAPAVAFAAPVACNAAPCRAVPVASVSVRRKGWLGWRRGR